MIDFKAVAEAYLRAVYTGDAEAVDELVSDEVVSSYPVFAELFGQASLRGRQAVVEFARGFGRRWREAVFTFHDVIGEGRRVVLLWQFEARFVGEAPAAGVVDDARQSWGGLTYILFDERGRVAAEVGEESAPGPVARAGAVFFGQT